LQIALPVHICRGIGIVTDFYDDSFLWSFICAFLILRAIALIVSVGMVIFHLGSPNSRIGQVAVNWLALTWISTVILGVPISKAVFGDASVGQSFGFLAGISRYASKRCEGETIEFLVVNFTHGLICAI